MSFFGNLLKGIGKGLAGFANFIPGIGGIVSSGLNSIIDGFDKDAAQKKSYAQAMKIAQMQMQSNQQMNAANIASQEKINQQMIDFQKDVNAIMRYDSKHAISDKKADLMRAGYSTANPEMTGFSAASLGAPTLTAPHVASEFDSGALIGGLDSFTKMNESLAHIGLMRAQSASTEVATDGARIDNLYKNVEHILGQQKLGEDIKVAIANRELTEKQGRKVLKDIEVAEQQRGNLAEAVKAAKFDNEHRQERFDAEMRESKARINEIAAKVDVLGVEKSIKEIDKEIREIEKTLQSYGISPSGTDFFSAIMRVIHSPEGIPFLSSALTYLGQWFDIALGKQRYNPETGSFEPNPDR